MILRLSPRLARKVHANELDDRELHCNPCADWSCRLFIAQRTEYILVSNTVSMYSCLMLGKDITDLDVLLDRLLESMGRLMVADKQQLAFQRHVASASANATFAKSLNRAVPLSMSDQVHGAKLYLSDGMPADEIGLQLNNTRLSSFKNSAGRRFVKPRDLFLHFASQTPN